MVLEHVGTVATAYGVIKQVATVFKELPQSEAIVEAQRQLIEAQSLVLKDQETMHSLREDKAALQAEVRQLRDVSNRLKKYELHLVEDTVAAYVSGQFLLCADCAERNAMSYLAKDKFYGGYTLKCSSCGEKGTVHTEDVRRNTPRRPRGTYV